MGAISPADAHTDTADAYVDPLAEAADTPILNWVSCDDGFLCATAKVPLDYNRPRDEQIDLAVNPNLIPGAPNAGVGPARPAFLGRQTNTWIQGITLGLTVSW